jgi:hypothetical protein
VSIRGRGVGRCDRTSTRADIERLTNVLEDERRIRNQKEQYSALAKRIHQYPSREETQAEITRLEAEITQLEQESGAVASALELRSKRFAGFMHALHDMQVGARRPHTVVHLLIKRALAHTCVVAPRARAAAPARERGRRDERRGGADGELMRRRRAASRTPSRRCP